MKGSIRMIVKKCKAPGCCLLAEANTRYCAKHSEYEKKITTYYKPTVKPYINADKPNQQFYNTYRWKMLRSKLLKQQHYCTICGSEDNLTVDHIFPPKGNEELFYMEENLQVLCFSCHNKKTAQEVAALKR